MSDRAEPVLAAALQRLIEDGTLTREQAEAVSSTFRADLQSRPADDHGLSWTPVLAEVGGYVGAAFVVAAAVALLGPTWDNFSQAGRIAVLAGPGVLLLIAAAVVAGALGRSGFRPALGRTVEGQAGQGSPGEQPASAAIRRLIGALVLGGGGLLGGAAAVSSLDLGSDRWVPLVPLVVWAIGYALFRGIPLHLGTAAALTWSVFTVIDSGHSDRFPLAGLVLIVAGVGWAVLAQYRVIREQSLAIAVAGVMAFIGGEYAATSDYEALGYVLLGLLAVTGLAAYVRTQELAALGVGAASLAVVVPQVVIDYTEGSLGAAGGLLVSGLSIVAVSVLAARLRRSSSSPTQVV
jgi:hypothetical protein